MGQIFRKASYFIAYLFGSSQAQAEKKPVATQTAPNIRPEFDSTFNRLMKDHEGLWQELAK